MKIKLLEIAHGRSGDKGDAANVGIIAYDDKGYEIIKKYLTVEKVKEHFLFFFIFQGAAGVFCYFFGSGVHVPVPLCAYNVKPAHRDAFAAAGAFLRVILNLAVHDF